MKYEDRDCSSVLQMTEEQVLAYYQEFLESQHYMTTFSNTNVQENLDSFEQYAIDEGIIADTPEQRGAITKAIVRAEFATVVAGGNYAGYTTAAALLDHSLQDAPSNLSYGSSSSYATQIRKSTECKKIISDFAAAVRGSSASSKTISASVTLASTTDLHLAYNRVSYVASGVKTTDGKWKLTIKFKDTYNFEKQEWENEMTDNAVVTVLNNYAAYAQSIGAIVPYDITVTVSTTVAG